MVVDPFHDLIQGVLQGHALAQQLRNESQQQEMYQRSLARSQEDDQLRDMEVRQRMATLGRPVTGNMVSEDVPVPDTTDPSAMGAMPSGLAAPKTTTITRPVDKSRLLKYKDQQVEAYTPQEFATRAAQMQEGAKNFTAMGDYRRAQYIDAISRATQGSEPPPDAVAFGLWPAGRKVLPGEMGGLQKQIEEEYASYLKPIGEGQGLVQTRPFPPGVQGPGPQQAGAPAAPAPQPPGPPAAPPSSGPTPFGSGAPMVNAPAGGSAALTGGAGPLTPAQQDFVNKTSAFRNAQGPSAAPLTSLLTPAQQNFVSSAKAAGAGTPAATAPAATAPGAQAYPRVVFQGGVKGDLEEKMMAKYASDFKNLDGSAKTFDQLTGAEADTLMARFKRNNKDPVAVADMAARLAEARAAREQAQQFRVQTHQDTLNYQNEQVGTRSYDKAAAELQKLNAPVEEQANAFQNIRESLANKTLPADSVIAEQFLKTTVGSKNLRMSQPIIDRVFGSRTAFDNLRAKISRYNPLDNQPMDISDKQRQQMIDFLKPMGDRVFLRQGVLKDARDALLNAGNNQNAHRLIMNDLQDKIAAIDSGKLLPTAAAPGTAPAAAKAPAGPAAVATPTAVKAPAPVTAPNPMLVAKLPRGNGQKAAQVIVDQYLDAYGDPVKAANALHRNGFQ